MPRHKTAHRKRLEAHDKSIAAARAELLKAAKDDASLKAERSSEREAVQVALSRAFFKVGQSA